MANRPMPHDVTLPEGWTTDPEELDYEGDWAADDSDGQKLTAHYGLGRGRPIMWQPASYTLMFEAGGKFCFWERMDQTVVEITASTDLDKIICILSEKREHALKLKRK